MDGRGSQGLPQGHKSELVLDMRGSLDHGNERFNIETDATHVYAWVTSESGHRLAGATFQNDQPSDVCIVVGTWNAGDPVALAAMSTDDAAVYLNEHDWQAGLWHVRVQADTPQGALRVGLEEARARCQPPRLTDIPDQVLTETERPWPRSA